MKKKYRIRKSGDKWRTLGKEELSNILDKLTIAEGLEVRVLCPHTCTLNDGGIKVCQACGDHLEVTSWRD